DHHFLPIILFHSRLIESIPILSTTTQFQQLYTLSLHDALPILACHNYYPKEYTGLSMEKVCKINEFLRLKGIQTMGFVPGDMTRSEEHTSELQSRFDIVCRLLLEKKK